MEVSKLKIESKKYRQESTIMTCRLPKDMLSELDSIAERTGRTRNELVQTMLEFAIKNVEIE